MRNFGLKNRHHNVVMLSAVVLLAAALSGTTVQAQGIETIPRTAILRETESTSLLCRYGKPLQYCMITIPGLKDPLVLSKKFPSVTKGYAYYGEGEESGHCGVSIERVTAQNHGNVSCRMASDGQLLESTIELVVAHAPMAPEFEWIEPRDRRTTFEVSETLRIKCVSRDGRPNANLTWFLGDEPITYGLGFPLTTETVTRNTTLLTIEQELTRQIQASDDGKSLTCRSTHLADERGPMDTHLPISVRYQPQPQSEIGIYGLTLDRTAIINVTIVANPQPMTEWIVDGVSIPQGTQNGRYESYVPYDLGHGTYNVSLSIAGLTLEDTTKIYHLKASNQYGATDYRIRVSSLDTPPATGLEIGAIVGISIVVIVVLVVGLLVVFARVTRRWCFGERSSQQPPNETNDDFHSGVDSALLERPKKGGGLLKKRQEGKHLNNNNRQNGDQRVYNPTTIPIDKNSEQTPAGSGNSELPPHGDGFNQTASDDGGEGGGDIDEVTRRSLLTQGNELGIPESRFSRWLPKDQREILQKQAQLLVGRGQSPQRKNTQVTDM